MTPCLIIQPFPFLQVDTTPDYFTTAKGNESSFYWANRIVGLADPHFHHVGDLDDTRNDNGLGHARINKVDRALAAGETVDFEAENQAIVIKIRKRQDQLLDKILLDANNLMTNHFSW